MEATVRHPDDPDDEAIPLPVVELADEWENVFGVGIDAAKIVMGHPVAVCRSCDLVVYSDDRFHDWGFGETGRTRDDPEADARRHAERYDHPVDLIRNDGEGHTERVYFGPEHRAPEMISR